MDVGALPDKTGDTARQWARWAVLGIVRESGGRTTTRPVFRIICHAVDLDSEPAALLRQMQDLASHIAA